MREELQGDQPSRLARQEAKGKGFDEREYSVILSPDKNGSFNTANGNSSQPWDQLVVEAEDHFTPPIRLITRILNLRMESFPEVEGPYELEATESYGTNADLYAGSHPLLHASQAAEDPRLSTDGVFNIAEIDQIYSCQGTTGNTSYYFPEDLDKPSWKPLVLRKAYLSVLILLSIGMAASQEILLQWSQSKGRLIQFHSPQNISHGVYFSWRYLPTIITVLFGIAHQILDTQVKRLDPFFRLAQPQGAPALQSLVVDTSNFFTWIRPPWPASRRVILSTISMVLTVAVLPTVQAASLDVKEVANDKEPPSHYIVFVSVIWSRVITVLLCLNALCCLLLLLALRCKSGLLHDPKGIVALAAMCTRSHILLNFEGLDGNSSDHEITERIRNRMFVLYKSSLWEGEFRTQTEDGPEASEGYRKMEPYPVTLSKTEFAFVLGVPAFLLALVPCLVFTEAHWLIIRLPFLLVGFAVLVKLLWGILDTRLRLVEPYYRLILGSASARTLGLDYSGTFLYTLPIRAFLNKHYLLSLVGSGTILLDVLAVSLASCAIRGSSFFHRTGEAPENSILKGNAETFKSFWVSFMLSMVILVLLCVTTISAFWKRRKIVLPRKPGSLAFIILNCHQAQWLVSLVDTETWSTKQIIEFLEHSGKTFGLGWYAGRDGKIYCGIDEEPLVGRWSVNSSLANEPEVWKEA
ncbi:hypothetical protein BU16DRAFT_617246 [Lophium mytilinum]|uniref:Uncharacterized protein n=1 Tax=Lophium mytilinum TaxID=390894 RepID=A0A6A6QXQ5_9PEZI|nr:hypothetical protein BU16DRAFT_617246 [Lophium mytilinum]